MNDISDIINVRKTGDYQRENFDSFLRKIHFEYKVPSIHIAGTNGKGSTAQYLYSILKESGNNVGLFVTPYTEFYNDSITVNGAPISDNDISQIVFEHKDLISKHNLSSFEILCFVAFTYFKEKNVDIGIIECGMGGEFDATNIFTPIVSIITSVSVEHSDYLGKTISEIALHKSGIIKNEIPLVVGDLNDDAFSVVCNKALQCKSRLIRVSEPSNILYDNGYTFSYSKYLDLKIKSPALYSVKDACIAIDAIDLIFEKFHCSEDAIKNGLEKAIIPLRMEKIFANRDVFLDCGHNPEAIINLKKSLEPLISNKNLHILFCCFKDKNLNAMLSTLGMMTKDITLTTFNHPRARTKMEYFLYLDEYKFENDALVALTNLMKTYPEDLILVTGSFGFVSYIKNLCKNQVI